MRRGPSGSLRAPAPAAPVLTERRCVHTPTVPAPSVCTLLPTPGHVVQCVRVVPITTVSTATDRGSRPPISPVTFAPVSTALWSVSGDPVHRSTALTHTRLRECAVLNVQTVHLKTTCLWTGRPSLTRCVCVRSVCAWTGEWTARRLSARAPTATPPDPGPAATTPATAAVMLGRSTRMGRTSHIPPTNAGPAPV